MRPLLALAGIACLVAGGHSRERLLAEQTIPYLEDAIVPRAVASVRAAVHGRGDAVWLTVEVGALGAAVEPLPGFEGVQGANLRTAEELHALLQDGALALQTRQGGAGLAGRLQEVRSGRLPCRRLLPDGALAEATTPAAFPVAVVFRSAELPEGTSHSYLLATGVPRLCVSVQRTFGRARIAGIESLGEPAVAPVRRHP